MSKHYDYSSDTNFKKFYQMLLKVKQAQLKVSTGNKKFLKKVILLMKTSKTYFSKISKYIKYQICMKILMLSFF